MHTKFLKLTPKTWMVLGVGLLLSEVVFVSAAVAENARPGQPTRDVPVWAPEPASVSVELITGLAERTWEPIQEGLAVLARYEEPAFALPVLPRRYTPSGVPTDWGSPLLLRATGRVCLPTGQYVLLLRARGAARLSLAGKLIAETPFPSVAPDGHERLPQAPPTAHPDLPALRAAHQERIASVRGNGEFVEVRLELVVGGQKLRVETGEPMVAVARVGPDGQPEPFGLLRPGMFDPRAAEPLTEDTWAHWLRQALDRAERRNQQARQAAQANDADRWRARHKLAREVWAQQHPTPAVPTVSAGTPVHNDIDRFIGAGLEANKLSPTPLTEDWAFLRRVTLDTVGVIPSPAELAAFAADRSSDRRARVIDRLLSDPRRADGWMGYWQDVLAENPGLLKPELNNTGPFRVWLHEALRDNRPWDRLVTELTLMQGSSEAGGPAGFGLASQNDVPLAAKAQILARAFLAADLSCARCHDAPNGPYRQRQLFGMAALLSRKPIKVPATSSVPIDPTATRKPLVKVSIQPGDSVSPSWSLRRLAEGELPEELKALLANPADTREQLAAILTGPVSDRFPKVLVNRVWRRLMGRGLVEPVDDWTDDYPPIHPELLDYLAGEFVRSGYDLRHVERLILNSHAYQRQVCDAPPEQAVWFPGPTRRRLSAEQIVDSLLAAAGKDFGCEELNFDPEGRTRIGQCRNLGVPTRAWQMASLANERDRPALALPTAQILVDVLQAFGWRDSRQDSRTDRDLTPTPLQPMVLANGGLVTGRVARLSDDGAFTELCLSAESPSALVDALFARVLTRPPTEAERRAFTSLLAEGFDKRRVPAPLIRKPFRVERVSWSNHLSPEATLAKQQQEAEVRAGDPPTGRLGPDWRMRAEDVIWSLVNAPEFVFLP